jgi:hypothetical protein
MKVIRYSNLKIGQDFTSGAAEYRKNAPVCQ